MEDINVRSFSTEIEPVKREIRLLNERNDYFGYSFTEFHLSLFCQFYLN